MKRLTATTRITSYSFPPSKVQLFDTWPWEADTDLNFYRRFATTSLADHVTLPENRRAKPSHAHGHSEAFGEYYQGWDIDWRVGKHGVILTFNALDADDSERLALLAHQKLIVNRNGATSSR